MSSDPTISAGGPASADGVLDRETFAALFRRHPAGVAVVSLTDGARPLGFTATSVISVSAQPAVLAFSINGTSSAWPALSRAETVTINLLAADQRQVSTVFATSGIDRFAQVDWHQLPTGEPVLYGTAGWISGRILERVPAGGSYVVIVAADRAELSNEEPLVYRNRTYHQLLEYEI
ncbi:flavin reductase family protein [Brachybacterium sacelli]|uniref:Flavin reductase (DIM6/NTAB) family NADH-FMN oxidoreductase RutF n=1 Tax=Brachybacterium sacelli TaxID=173364 RepID=A0ABS4WVZ0_9MICO|nr:flavin reductase family protein [Brachybacterium sacelli]MBP2380311.1 flavin reductase (DIM6/NTAB) family NADH-FMN oxidoreductase RutF [Brachybacterium sacelli]